MDYKHLPFQCACNSIVTISSYIMGNYDYYNVEQIQEFIVSKGAIEIASVLEKYDDAPYKFENLAIREFCCENYQNENGYIMRYIKTYNSPKEESNALQEPMEEEISKTGSSLDEKEEESDDQKEEEWSSYPCLPSNESNSLTHTISYLFDCPPCLPKEDE